MRLLYGRHYAARHRAIAELIPEGESVLELCCGPGRLYTDHLRGHVAGYTGLDLNRRFVEVLAGAGAGAEVRDLRGPEPLPRADNVLMQASLYHFLPEAAPVVERMLAAARRQAIVAEPVRNLASSANPLLSLAGRLLTDPGEGGHAARFSEQTLDELFARWRDRVIRSFEIPGGREKVYVLEGAADG